MKKAKKLSPNKKMSPTLKADSISVLLEALPYIRHFKRQSVVVKFGGAAMQNAELCRDFARDIVLLQHVGIRPIVVHGGGPQINQMLEGLGISPEFIEGHRVTNEASMEIVEMVLAGKINKEIVGMINKEGGQAIGISGRDANLASARPYSLEKIHGSGKKELLTLGKVGKLGSKDISSQLLHTLEKEGYVPVIAPIATDEEGSALNINADTMAGAVAAAMKAKKLILLSDTPGVVIDKKTLAYIDPESVAQLKKNKQISGGMIPKVDCCVEAVNSGVDQAHIIDGRTGHALLMEIFTDKGIGSMICKKEKTP